MKEVKLTALKAACDMEKVSLEEGVDMLGGIEIDGELVVAESIIIGHDDQLIQSLANKVQGNMNGLDFSGETVLWHRS